MNNSHKTALIILDGWGIGDGSKSDAIQQANTPFIDSLSKKYPNSTLTTFGEEVGLPKGQMGNSEVGHLNIGAGRIVYQDLLKINRAIESKTFFQEKALQQTAEYAKKNNKPIHLMGLLSDGGVHAHLKHLCALISFFESQKCPQVYIHAFTDGRDTNPKSATHFLKLLLEFLKNRPSKIASIIGRYYAMDRDQRWERTQKAYDLWVHQKGTATENPIELIKQYYTQEITDEFLPPIVCKNTSTPIKEEDAVLCFNFRTDRCRQLTEVLTQSCQLNMKPLSLHYTTMTKYDQRFSGIHIVYDKADLKNTMGEVLSTHKKTQLRAAETEKYPHVTFFFSGGREQPFEGEVRTMAPSPKVATYDLKPEMSAQLLTQKVKKEVQMNAPDFICMNYANPDMVGHTGVYKAIIKAAEQVDQSVKKIVQELQKHKYHILLIADHGNADLALNKDGSPNTAHSMNLVPCICLSDQVNTLKDGNLSDIAPTLLTLMNLPIPSEMTGKSLIKQ